ncbi:Rieske (2Fe-2S) protein [Caldiplasma sukawensis]
MTWYKVGKADKIAEGDIAKVKAGDKEILIMKDSGKIYSTSTLCTHEEYDLADGFMDEHCLTCPNHFAAFDPATGKVVHPPEGSGDISPLKAYKVKIENGEIMVDVE